MLTYERKLAHRNGEATVAISEDGTIEIRDYDRAYDEMLGAMGGTDSPCLELAELLGRVDESAPAKLYALEWVVDDIRGAWALAADSTELAFWEYAEKFYEPWKQEFEKTNPGFVMKSVHIVRKIIDVRTRFFPSDWFRQEFDAGVPCSPDELSALCDTADDALTNVERAGFWGPDNREKRVLEGLYGAVSRLYRSIRNHGAFMTNFSYGQTMREKREEWFELAVRDAVGAVHHACWSRSHVGVSARQSHQAYCRVADESFGRFVAGMHELDNYRPWPELKR